MGGKRSVFKNHLINHLPKNYQNYLEPFLGGGAVLAHLKPQKAIVNDLNSNLINVYQSIKINPNKLMKYLDKYKQDHCYENYYKNRQKIIKNNILRAANFIYLNKACFNGLYRVNSKNLFNVPWNGKLKKELTLYSKNNLLNWNKYLLENNIIILNLDYLLVLDQACKNDFVYCDPPYDYEENTNSFTAYTKAGFNQKNQIELANKLKKLHKLGVKWMVSNHNTTLIQKLYKDFNIIPILTNRNINSKGNARKLTGKEVVVINYDY